MPLETKARRTGWIVMYVLTTITVLMSARYFLPGMPGAFQPEVYPDVAWVLRIHIGGGIAAILAGPFQFWSAFRDNHRDWHRRLGKIYLIGVALSASGGLVMATVSWGGMVTHMGFGLLALLWAATTFVAFRHIRAGDWRTHREWMIRSFALALAFVMLRVWLQLLGASGVSELEAFQTVSWLCWVPNLIAAEIYIVWWRNREAGPQAAD